MSHAFRQAMDALYRLCVLVAGVALVLTAIVIPWGVYTRYVINRAASWPEPLAILLTVVLTFFGMAACYRIGMHMRINFGVMMLPEGWRRSTERFAEAMVGLLSLFMVIWGVRLVEATWYQVIDEFPFLSVGITYMPIPLGGAALLLFVIERLTIGAPTRAAVAESAAFD